MCLIEYPMAKQFQGDSISGPSLKNQVTNLISPSPKYIQKT